jgi:hypothetical protein
MIRSMEEFTSASWLEGVNGVQIGVDQSEVGMCRRAFKNVEI